MKNVDTIRAGLSMLKWNVPKCKINPKTLGYLHPDGKIGFSSQDAALGYAKNRVVQALNAPKPFERGLVIRDNVVLGEANGNGSYVVMPKELLEGECICVHGHPDTFREKFGIKLKTIKDYIKYTLRIDRKTSAKPTGVTYPVSVQDYRSLMMNPFQNQEIVYNSKGEYSMLTKKIKGKTLNEQELLEFDHEYITEIENGCLRDIKKFFRNIYYRFLPVQKANELALKHEKSQIRDIHDFMTRNNQHVEYTTNYSCL